MSTVKLADLIRAPVKALTPYQVKNFDCPVKLHANENPFRLPEEISAHFQERLKELSLNRYPDSDSQSLKQTLSERLGTPAENLVVGNGSDELIQLILQVFCVQESAVAFPDPTFGMYSIIAQGMGLNPRVHPLDEKWDFQADPLLETVKRHDARIIFFSYPNNPTGNCFSKDEIQQVIENFQGIVVVDEAYHDFAKTSFVEQTKDHNNLIILRSLSKIGLAGLRVGYGIADPFVIQQINKVRLPYNSNIISQTFSEIVLKHFAPIQTQIDQIIEERDRVYQALSKINSLTAFPSDANFILFQMEQDAGVVFNRLMERGVLIRDLSGHPRLKNCLRVTVGAREENDQFLTQINNLS